MHRWPKFSITLFIVMLTITIGILRLYSDFHQPNEIVQPTPMPTPDPPFTWYTPPKIKPAPFYVIAFLGDSMTHALGPHGGKFTEYIQAKYPDKGFVVSNYSSPTTSVLSISERLTKPTTVWGETFPPLLEWDFHILILESFGYNPLSQFSLEEGLKAQREILDQTMKTVTAKKPGVLVIFLTTIAPSKIRYAQKVLTLSPQDRLIQVNERIAYIKNHIAYAQEHNIPLINVFDKSLNESQDGDLRYINPDDNIHPSFAGIELIAREISDYISNNQLLPE